MSVLRIMRPTGALLLSSLTLLFSLAANQEVLASATSECEQEAAAAGLSDYPDLVRQYVIECVEQHQPGSRENLESSYRLPETAQELPVPTEPATEPGTEAEVAAESQAPEADNAAPPDQVPAE